MTSDDQPGKFATQTVWAGLDPERYPAWDLMPPISCTTIFKETEPGKWPIADYTRSVNPTRTALQEALAKLENGQSGLVFSSGMGAVSAIMHLLHAGDHAVLSRDIYHGVVTYFDQVARMMNIEGSFVDMTDVEGLGAELQPNTRLIWIESVTNPTLEVLNIKEIVALARRHNPEILVAVDNTFLTPYFLRPLEVEGVDIAMMSLTKYIGGHHDVTMGSIVVNDKILLERLYTLQYTLGAVPSPSDCYQVIRSLKTLHLRMEKHKSNGLQVARYLESHPRIKNLNHPLLESHRQHDLAMKQNKGHSGMIFCELDGTKENVAKFSKSLKLVTPATSLGGVMSTVDFPRSISVGGLDPSKVRVRPVADTALRISIGLEDVEDIIADFEQALKEAFS